MHSVWRMARYGKDGECFGATKFTAYIAIASSSESSHNAFLIPLPAGGLRVRLLLSDNVNNNAVAVRRGPALAPDINEPHD